MKRIILLFCLSACLYAQEFDYLLPDDFDTNEYKEYYTNDKEEHIENKKTNTPTKPTIFYYINPSYKIKDTIINLQNYLDKGGDINATNTNGNTILMEASSIGYYDLVDYIIDKKAEINFTNSNGENALILSADYPYILNLLIENNADVNAIDNKGKTALLTAAEKGNIMSVQLLIKEKSNINQKDILGKNILMYAVESENLDLVKYLVEKVKVDINEKDDWGQNAIFYVTKIEMARYLIYNDIDYKSRNSIGLKAYEVLKYNNKINVSNYLQKLYNDE